MVHPEDWSPEKEDPMRMIAKLMEKAMEKLAPPPPQVIGVGPHAPNIEFPFLEARMIENGVILRYLKSNHQRVEVFVPGAEEAIAHVRKAFEAAKSSPGIRPLGTVGGIGEPD